MGSISINSLDRRPAYLATAAEVSNDRITCAEAGLAGASGAIRQDRSFITIIFVEYERPNIRRDVDAAFLEQLF